MSSYFARPLAAACEKQAAVDAESMARRKGQLEAFFAMRSLTPEDIARFTKLTGLAVRNNPKTGADLAKTMAVGDYLQTRIFIGG